MLPQKCLLFALLSTLLVASNAQLQCSGSGRMTDGTYVFEWSVQSNGMYLDANVSVDTSANRWVAVGFSADRMMPSTDVVIGANDGTNQFVEDRWNGASRTVGPLIDAIQNIANTSSSRNGNTLTISFTRPIDSPDTSGRDIDLNVCRYVLWSWGGTVGNFPSNSSSTASNLGGHQSRGIFNNQICLCTSAASSVVSVLSLMMIMLVAGSTAAVVTN